MIGVAVIGVGFMGRTHLEAWKYVENAKVVCVVSKSREKAAELSSRYNVEVINDYEQALKREDVNVVDICVPTYLHREYVEKAMEYRKHTLLEKPIANSLEDAETIIKKAEKSDVKLMVLNV